MNFNSNEGFTESKSEMFKTNNNELKSFDLQQSPHLFANNDDTSPSLMHSNEKNSVFNSFCMKLCIKLRNKDFFMPISTDVQENSKANNKCFNFFLIWIILGVMIKTLSFVFIFDLKENSFKFLLSFIIGSLLITFSLMFIKGFHSFIIFALTSNIFSIFFSYFFNLLILCFFVIKAQSSIFSSIFAISQVFFHYCFIFFF